MDQIKTYKKKDSFLNLKNKKNIEKSSLIKNFINILNNNLIMSSLNNQDKEILGLIKKDFTERNTQDNKSIFKLKENTIAELNTFKSDKEVINYLINRYKYEVYPIIKKLDEYPPLIQIEPSSICNFRVEKNY